MSLNIYSVFKIFLLLRLIDVNYLIIIIVIIYRNNILNFEFIRVKYLCKKRFYDNFLARLFSSVIGGKESCYINSLRIYRVVSIINYLLFFWYFIRTKRILCLYTNFKHTHNRDKIWSRVYFLFWCIIFYLF